jgi:hypothetical protein
MSLLWSCSSRMNHAKMARLLMEFALTFDSIDNSEEY